MKGQIGPLGRPGRISHRCSYDATAGLWGRGGEWAEGREPWGLDAGGHWDCTVDWTAIGERISAADAERVLPVPLRRGRVKSGSCGGPDGFEAALLCLDPSVYFIWSCVLSQMGCQSSRLLFWGGWAG